MLNRLRKRFERFLAPATREPQPEPEAETAASADVEAAPAGPGAEELAAARKEARRREARLILSERIHNRATALLGELRDALLADIHASLEEESGTQSLNALLQVALDPAFTRRLDEVIEEKVRGLLERLRSEFGDEAEVRLPEAEALATELKGYRDQILRTHLLEQLEVFALPSLASAFPDKKVSPEELRRNIASYWASCREAMDRFFRSVEMALLNGARAGIRLDANLIRERLLAAQFKNGYRRLEERLRSLYGQIAELQMSRRSGASKALAAADRRIVDEVIVPLAFFIRERTENEPREALRGRAELFGEIIDKLVASGEPFPQTAEAVKPLLRRSIEQARPLALQSFPYLRPAIESFKASEIHRTTALFQLLETLLQPDLDEDALARVEQTIRLGKEQYHLYLLLRRQDRPVLEPFLPLDRIHAADARFLARCIEEMTPSADAIVDLGRRLGYVPWPDPLPEGVDALVRLVAVLALTADELAGWHELYAPEGPSDELRARLADLLVERITPTSIGADERQAELGALPFPVDLARVLGRIGYRPDDKDRLDAFRDELRTVVRSGDADGLRQALSSLRRLDRAAREERIELGVVGADTAPYLIEVWLKDSGEMVGLLFFDEEGFGRRPVETIVRSPNGGNRQELDRSLRRQLRSQAVIYQSFHRLFRRAVALPRERRRALPAYLKVTYERVSPTRHSLLTHLRNGREMVRRIDELASFVVEADRTAEPAAVAVRHILEGFGRKLDELVETSARLRAATDLARPAREYERVLRYLNLVLVHAVNPWLREQTRGLTTELEFREEEVREAIRREAEARGIDWDHDVEECEAHRIRGTLGCRALLRLADGSSKVVLLEYDRRRRAWRVKHFAPRLTDVVRAELKRHDRFLPEDWDEKYEQPTFRLEEQSCRFLLVKKGVVRVEATLVLDGAEPEQPWRVVYLRWNDDVLVDQSGASSSAAAS